jgi:hypothetical protein
MIYDHFNDEAKFELGNDRKCSYKFFRTSLQVIEEPALTLKIKSG